MAVDRCRRRRAANRCYRGSPTGLTGSGTGWVFFPTECLQRASVFRRCGCRDASISALTLDCSSAKALARAAGSSAARRSRMAVSTARNAGYDAMTLRPMPLAIWSRRLMDRLRGRCWWPRGAVSEVNSGASRPMPWDGIRSSMSRAAIAICCNRHCLAQNRRLPDWAHPVGSSTVLRALCALRTRGAAGWQGPLVLFIRVPV